MIGLKAGIEIEIAGNLQNPTDLVHLPSGPFQVSRISLDNHQNLNDNEMALISRLKGLKWLKWLSLNWTPVDDSWMPIVGKLTRLPGLQLMGTRVTDSGLKELSGRKDLKLLWLTFTAIGNDGMDTVAGLTSLRVLGLGECRVGNEGLAKLKSLCHLEHIHLGGQVTDQGLKHLADFPKLTSVAGLKSHHLTETGISHLQQLTKCTSMNVVAATDEDLIRLKSLTKVRTFSFNYNRFTVSGVESLQALFPELEGLILDAGSNVDDTFLIPLTRFASLRKLSLNQTKVTADGIAKFRELRPDVDLSPVNH